MDTWVYKFTDTHKIILIYTWDQSRLIETESLRDVLNVEMTKSLHIF